MKKIPFLFTCASAVLLSSCVDPYLAGGLPPRSDGPIIVDRQPVVVDGRRYVEERPPVTVERYSTQSYSEPGTRTYVDPRTPSYGDSRPYYGDPAPSTTYQRRTTTRTYQGY